MIITIGLEIVDSIVTDSPVFDHKNEEEKKESLSISILLIEVLITKKDLSSWFEKHINAMEKKR